MSGEIWQHLPRKHVTLYTRVVVSSLFAVYSGLITEARPNERTFMLHDRPSTTVE